VEKLSKTTKTSITKADPVVD